MIFTNSLKSTKYIFFVVSKEKKKKYTAVDDALAGLWKLLARRAFPSVQTFPVPAPTSYRTVPHISNLYHGSGYRECATSGSNGAAWPVGMCGGWGRAPAPPAGTGGLARQVGKPIGPLAPAHGRRSGETAGREKGEGAAQTELG